MTRTVTKSNVKKAKYDIWKSKRNDEQEGRKKGE